MVPGKEKPPKKAADKKSSQMDCTVAETKKDKLHSKKLKVSRSQRAQVTFPVSRLHRYLKQGNYSKMVGVGAGVYAAGVLEYLVAEILELAGNAAHDNNKCRITPRHLALAIGNDEELAKLLSHVTLAQGGVLPHIDPHLLPKTKKKQPQDQSEQSGSQEY